MTRLLIVGAGGHGRSVAEAAMMSGHYEVAGFVDDSAVDIKDIWGIPMLGETGNLLAYRSLTQAVIVAIGNNNARRRLSDRFVQAGYELVSVLHPRATISSRAVIGPGSAIMAGAIIGTEAQLGRGVIVNCGAIVDHHARVADFGHLGVNACMAGGTVLGRGAWLQAGSAIGYGVQVPDGSILGPGEALP